MRSSKFQLNFKNSTTYFNLTLTVADPMGALDGPISFIFMQFSAIILPNNRISPQTKNILWQINFVTFFFNFPKYEKFSKVERSSFQLTFSVIVGGFDRSVALFSISGFYLFLQFFFFEIGKFVY